MPLKTSRDILLFFTFKGSDSLYFISHNGMDIFGEEYVPVLTLPLEEFKLNIQFQCMQPHYSKSFSYKVIPIHGIIFILKGFSLLSQQFHYF